MKKLFFIVSIIFILFVCEIFAEIKGAFIDWQLISDKHPLAQKRLSELEEWAKPYKSKINDYEKKLMDMEQDYQENIMASEKIKRDKELAYQKLYMEYQNYLKDFKERLQIKQNELLPDDVQMSISQDLLNILKKICKEKDLNVIYDRTKSGAVYVDEELDITKQVLDELNKIKIPTNDKTETQSKSKKK
ncbi:MAG TPA: OmpH family outer membrane protein [bacterium]|nr:OmpH family outer membrane protein [bacterium]HOL48509.1 OmpH family outer membrane protein [bacterium]HPQ20006.1 OmpH family outer membrane protein [bacterium]